MTSKLSWWTLAACVVASAACSKPSNGLPDGSLADASRADAPADAMEAPSISPDSPTVDQLSQTTFSVTGAADAVAWTVEESDGGTIDAASGVYVAPAHAGTYHVDASAGALHLTSAVTVRSVSIAFSPSDLTVNFGDGVGLGAVVSGTKNHAVTYALMEANGGMLTGSTYVAPSTAGTYHVIATSVADPSATATLAIHVQHPPYYAVQFNLINNTAPVSLELNGDASTVVVATGGPGSFSPLVGVGATFHVQVRAYNGMGVCLVQDGYGVMGTADVVVKVDCNPPRLALSPGLETMRVLPTSAAKFIALVANAFGASMQGFTASLNPDSGFSSTVGGPVDFVVDASDRAIVLQIGNNSTTLTRLTPTGSIDTTFGTAGSVSIDFFGLGAGTVLNKLAVDGQGRILAAGYANNGAANVSAVVRLTSSGQLDTSFAGTGKFANMGITAAARKVVPSPAGPYVVADGGVVYHIHDNGTLDTSFQPGAFPGIVKDAAVTATGDLVVWFNDVSAQADSIVRLTATGATDATFNATVYSVPVDPANLKFGTGTMLVAADGSLTLASRVFVPDTSSVNLVSKLQPDGSLDTSFGRAGGRSFDSRGGQPIDGVFVWPGHGVVVTTKQLTDVTFVYPAQ